MRTPLSRATDVWIAIATAVGIAALTIPLFLNPVWVGFEQGRAQATVWTGFSEADLRTATDSILADLVIGPPDFDVTVGSGPVLNERERSHMRDVRGVFIGFFAVAIIAAVGALMIAARRSGEDRPGSWGAVRAGAVGLAIVLVVAGAVSFVAFDTLFDIFHGLFFASGSSTFDPTNERLVQLFPFQFWQESAIAVGAVAIVVALIVAVLARRRLTLAAAQASQTAPPTFEGSRP